MDRSSSKRRALAAVHCAVCTVQCTVNVHTGGAAVREESPEAPLPAPTDRPLVLPTCEPTRGILINWEPTRGILIGDEILNFPAVRRLGISYWDEILNFHPLRRLGGPYFQSSMWVLLLQFVHFCYFSRFTHFLPWPAPFPVPPITCLL